MRSIFTYWEGKLTWLERVSIASILAEGHPLTIFTMGNTELLREFAPASIVDVRDVVSLPDLALVYRQQRHYSLFADIVRLAMLKKSMGLWVDADCLFLRPFREEPFTMGWISPSRVNNAVLYMAPQLPLLNEYYDAITAVPVRLPWAPPHVRFLRGLSAMLGRGAAGNLKKTGIGPRALTYFVQRHHMEALVSPQERFYPIPDKNLALLVSADDRAARSRIGAATDLVHASRGRLEALGLLRSKPPATSFAGQACRRLGI